MVDNSLKSVVQKLEAAFVQNADFFLDETVAHAFETLCNCLKEINSKLELYSIDQKRELIVQLKRFQINLFRQLLVRFVPSIPTSVLNNLLDTILYQTQIEMEMSEIANDSYFDLSLSCLTADATIDYIREVRPSSFVEDHFLQLFCTIGNRAMWNKIKRCYGISVTRHTTPKFFQWNNETDRLLRGFLTYLNRHFRENPLSNTQATIFIWVQGMMDIIAFVPFFVNAGYPEVVVRWLSIESNESNISIKAWRESLDLIHNLARHESGVKALNQLEAFSTLKTWKERYLFDSTLSSDENYEDILVVYYMSYALLLSPAVLKQEDAATIRLALDHILDRGIQAFRSPSLRCGPYNVSEFWTALAKFTGNDKCLLYMLMRENMFAFFVQKFLEFNQVIMLGANSESSDLNILICSLLYTIFWSISFQSNYHAELKMNKEFIQFVQENSKVDSSDELIASIRRSANGILFNLDLVQESLGYNKPMINDHIDGVRVMISYSHKDSSFCRKLVNTLQNQIQGDLWADFIKLEPPYEDGWEEIAEAITNCDVVVMIVTANYCSSKSCRREVIHADKRQKRMIPIYQGSNYEPDDWFEIRVGSATWVRFGGTKSDDEVMETLVKLINSQEKTKQRSRAVTVHQTLDPESRGIVSPVMISSPSPQVLPPELPHPISTLTVPVSVVSMSSPVSIPRKPIEQWTNEEVQQWLRLPSSILQLSDGRALMAYVRLISNEKAQRDEYERCVRNRGLTREQWANLISSFMTLRVLYTVETSSKIPPEQWSSDEVKCWFEKNNLSNYLLDTFAFVDGMELVIYAKLMIDTPARIDSEYDRLRARIQARYKGQDLLQLDEYARLVRALRGIVERSQLSSSQRHETASCDKDEVADVFETF